MKFSERHGIVPVNEALQVESMDDALQNGLWNIFNGLYIAPFPGYRAADAPGGSGQIAFRVWAAHFKLALDEMPASIGGFGKSMRDWWFDSGTQWWARYDFIEFLVQSDDRDDRARGFAEGCNHILERERSGYRIVGNEVVRLTADEQVQAVEQALADTSPLAGVNHHLRQALKLLAERDDPDYANSIKESISAVEAVCSAIVGKKATLGNALDRLETAGVVLHPALKEGYKKIYGYTSDADGIRHAAAESPDVTLDDATYFLVSCSAFVSALIVKAGAAGIVMGSQEA